MSLLEYNKFEVRAKARRRADALKLQADTPIIRKAVEVVSIHYVQDDTLRAGTFKVYKHKKMKTFLMTNRFEIKIYKTGYKKISRERIELLTGDLL